MPYFITLDIDQDLDLPVADTATLDLPQGYDDLLRLWTAKKAAPAFAREFSAASQASLTECLAEVFGRTISRVNDADTRDGGVAGGRGGDVRLSDGAGVLMPKWPGFVGGTDLAATVSGSAADTVNWYVERLPDGAANTAALVPTPGFIPWGPALDAGRGGARAGVRRVHAPLRGDRVAARRVRLYGHRRPIAATSATMARPRRSCRTACLACGQLGIDSAGGVYCFNLYTNTLTGPHLTGGYTHLEICFSRGLAFNPTTGKVSLSALLRLHDVGRGLNVLFSGRCSRTRGSACSSIRTTWSG